MCLSISGIVKLSGESINWESRAGIVYETVKFYIWMYVIWFVVVKTCKGKLKMMRFKLNLYDPCVANKYVGRKKCAVFWCVGDVGISHRNNEVVNNIIRELESESGYMIVKKWRNIPLWAQIKITEDSKVEIFMKDDLTESIKAFGERHCVNSTK